MCHVGLRLCVCVFVPEPRVRNQKWKLRGQECVLLSFSELSSLVPSGLLGQGSRQEIPVERISF